MKRKSRSLILIVCCLISIFSAAAQTKPGIDSLLALLSKAKDDSVKVNLLNEIGYAYTNSQPDSTLIYCDRARQLAAEINFVSGEATSFNTIGIAYDNLGDLEKSLINYFIAEKLFDRIRDKKRIAKTYNDIGIIYYQLNKYDSALHYYSVSLHLRDSLHDKEGLAAVYSNLGLVYYDLGNKHKALEQILRAATIDEELDNKQGTADSYLNIGELYQGESTEKSNEFLTKALQLQEQIGDQEGMVYSLSALGINYRSSRDQPKAMEYFSKALALAEEIGLLKMMGLLHQSMGNVYEDNGSYDNAFKEYSTALEILDTLGDKRLIAGAHIHLGEIYTLQGQPDKAIAELNTALRLANESDLKPEKKNSYEGLAKAYEKKNDFRNAYENHKLASSIKDSLLNIEKAKAIAGLQTQYESQKKDEEIALLNTKSQLQQSENRKQRILRDAFVVGFVFVLLLAFLLYNGFRRKQKSNTKLAAMNEVVRQQKSQVEETLAELRISQNRLVQSEKMASLGQLTAGIAHEINNPINFVSSNVNPLKRNFSELKSLVERYEQVLLKNNGHETVEQLKKEFDKDFNLQESENLLKGIEEGSSRTAEIVKGLRNFSRLNVEVMKQSDINEGLESTLVLLQNKLRLHNIEVIKSFGSIPEIYCYPGELDQVFMNLFTNAIDAIGSNGKIFVTTSQQGSNIKISIRDTGTGISDELQAKIFDPFFTTKEVGKGTGLGLSISYGIIQKHNGKIEVKSQPGKGAEFIITLPVAGKT